MIRILLFLILFSTAIIAQTDWERWEAKDISYEMDSHNHSHKNDNSPGFILSALKV